MSRITEQKTAGARGSLSRFVSRQVGIRYGRLESLKPSKAKNPAMRNATQLTHMGTAHIFTMACHPKASRITCPSATKRKITLATKENTF